MLDVFVYFIQGRKINISARQAVNPGPGVLLDPVYPRPRWTPSDPGLAQLRIAETDSGSQGISLWNGEVLHSWQSCRSCIYTTWLMACPSVWYVCPSVCSPQRARCSSARRRSRTCRQHLQMSVEREAYLKGDTAPLRGSTLVPLVPLGKVQTLTMSAS